MDPPDAELIARVLRNDDRHAFGQLILRHQSPVRGLLRRLTGGDFAKADDLAQDTFLRAFRGLRSYRGGARFSSWLYRIAYNVYLSDRRRRTEVLASEASDVEQAEDRGGADLATRAELRRDLGRAMRLLSEGERAALALTYGAGATHEDAARILECPLGTVKSHITRAKQKLRRSLAAWEPGAAT